MPLSDPYGLIASGLPPELAARAMGLTRDQMIAQALMQQSQQPLENIGGVGAKISPFQGLAKIVQAYMGRQSLNDTDKKFADLAAQREKGYSSALSDYEKVRSGTPAVGNLTPVDDNGYPMPTSPAVPGDPRKAVAMAISNAYLRNSPLIAADMKAMQPHTVGHSLMTGTGQVIGTDPAFAQDRQMRIEEAQRAQTANLEARADQQRLAQEAAAERARQAALDRENLVRITAGMRPPPAPTMSTVLDPKDPTRMLMVDAKSYKGGTLGEPGVLGVAGKEPTAAKREEQVGQGRETVSSIISDLRGSYEQLGKSGGIVDPNKGTLSNLTSSIQSSGLGQIVGGALGTENQSLRNQIIQQRPLLLNAIKQATGMSAKQMDSNAELKMYLAAATDPKLDIKANLAALKKLEELYGLGAVKGGAPQPRATTMGVPSESDIDAELRRRGLTPKPGAGG